MDSKVRHIYMMMYKPHGWYLDHKHLVLEQACESLGIVYRPNKACGCWVCTQK
jgi:hypothetical protein